MSWLAVDKGGCEHIFAEKPCRNESNTLWICSVVYLYGQRYANTGCCYLPKGSIKKLIGKELSLNSATLLIVSGHCGQNRPECNFSCSIWLFAPYPN